VLVSKTASLDGKQNPPVPPPRPARGRPPPPLPSIHKNSRSRPAVPVFTNNFQESDTNLSESVSVSLQNASLDGKQKLSVPPPRPARGRPPQPSPSVRKISRSRPPFPLRPFFPNLNRPAITETHPVSPRMPVTSLRIADLDPLFASVSYEEATAIANLGAVCWTHFKDRLFAHWTTTANAEETDRADQYREEGRKAATAEVLESLKGRLAAADAAVARVSVLEASIESEVARKLAEQLVLVRKDTDLERLREINSIQEAATKRFYESERQTAEILSDLRQKLVAMEQEKLRVQREMSDTIQAKLAENDTHWQRQQNLTEQDHKRKLLELETQKLRDHSSLVEQIIVLTQQKERAEASSTELIHSKVTEAQALMLKEQMLLKEQLASYRERLVRMTELEVRTTEQHGMIEHLQSQIVALTPVKTKSSHEIGKEGEDQVLHLITTYVLPNFLYPEVLALTGKGHAGDFHVVLQSALGKRVKLLVEAKKYVRAVDKEEVLKFKRDCDNPDNHLDGGVLVSLTTPITSYCQFQIEKTEGGKNILYLTMQDMTTEEKGRTLLWAMRVLSTIVSLGEKGGDAKLIDKVVDFFRKLEVSRNDAEETVKACKKALECAELLRSSISTRLSEFQAETLSEWGIEAAVVPMASVAPKRAGGRKKAVASGV
jgi:hypothetical protein